MRNMTIFTGITADIRDRQNRVIGTGLDMLRVLSQHPRLYAKPSLRSWHLHLEQGACALPVEPAKAVRVASAGRLLVAAATAC